MGLFGSLLGALPVVGDVFSAVSNAGAIKKGSKAQIALQQQALAQQQAQYQQSRDDYAPYLQAGTNALGSELDLLGLGAQGSQQTAIDGLKASPLYTSLYGSGLDAINQSAAATGGLRGGNQALSQSNFGSSLLAQVIQQQLGNLGGISAQGLGATGNIASLGQANSSATSTNLTNQGNIQAGSILGQQGIYNNLSNQIQSTLSSVAGGGGAGGGLGALLSQLTGGGSSLTGTLPNGQRAPAYSAGGISW